MPDKEQNWHPEAIAGATEGALRSLQSASLLDAFYLAGGTGLALWFGHRLSDDLDFFAPESFNEELLLVRLQDQSDFSIVARSPQTLHVSIRGVRVSFLGYSYPVLYPHARFAGAAIADPRDIACMKVGAIAGRGAKRDFVDLYASAGRYGLKEIFRLFTVKYEQAAYTRTHILKSLTYYDDAEKDPMPRMLIPLEWDEVKQFFLREARALY